jgi:hypothetical protein
MTDTAHTDTPALTVALDQVAFVIVKAREFAAKVGATRLNEGSNAADEGQHRILENMRRDPVLQELEGAVAALPRESQRELVALSWIGRGEFTPADWNEACRQARDVGHDGEVSAYLLRDPLIGEELAEGLSQMGYDLSDYDVADRL